VRLRAGRDPGGADAPANDPVRIVHLVTSTGYAGIERHVLQVCEALRGLGCPVAVGCPPGAAQLRADALALGFECWPAADAPDRFWLARFFGDLRRRRPEVLHVHDGRAAVFGVAYGRLGIRVVRTQHFIRTASVERGRALGAVSVVGHRLLNRGLAAYVSITEAVAVAARARGEIGTTRSVVIASGIVLPDENDVTRADERRDANERFNVAFVGRLEPERELDVLVRAVPLVRERVPSARFVLAGSGSDRDRLQKLSADLVGGEVVTFPGWLQDPSDAFKDADAYVNTWPWEAFGMAMTEAMAWGLPVVAADSGANHEVIEHDASGLLVPPGDPVALANALIDLATDTDRARAMGAVARKRATDSFSVEETARELLALYDSLGT
jgi:glycosyltransferase involved in cell wall biosynthesis